MQTDAEIFAELDRALAEAETCKIATDQTPEEQTASLETHGFEGEQSDAALVGILTPSPTHSLDPAFAPSSPPSTYSSPAPSKRLQAAIVKARASVAGPWRKLWPHQKLGRAIIAAEQEGGISFTLNLSTQLQATLSNHPDPTRLMSHYINRELKAALGQAIPYAFNFEVSSAGRLHLHGVAVPVSFEEDHVRAIGRALAEAGGKLRAKCITRLTQSYLGTLYDGLGWFAYLQKGENDAADFLGTHKVTFISTALLKICTTPGRVHH